MAHEAAIPRPEARPWPPRYAEQGRFIIGLFLLFVVAHYIELGARRSIFRAIRVEFTLGFILTAICIGLLASHAVVLRNVRSILIGIGLLFFAMLVQLPFAADPVMAKWVFYEHVIKYSFLTFFMATLIQSPRTLRAFLLAFLVSCLYICYEGVRGQISGALVWENQGVMRLHGAVPIYGHPNSLGGLAMGAVPFAVFLLPVWRRKWERAGLLALLVSACVVVLYTGSRTAYVAFLGFLLFWWITSERKARWMLIALVLGAATFAIIPQQYKERFQSITGHEAEGESKEARIQILRDAWEIFLEHPGGIGVASFPAVRRAKFSRAQDTHNLYLEVATNLGVQGLAVFGFLVWAILAGFRRAQSAVRRQRAALRARLRDPTLPRPWRRWLGRQDRDLRFLLAVCRAGAAFIWVRLLLGLFGMDLYEIYWWFAAGLAISLMTVAQATAKAGARLLELCAEECGDLVGAPAP